MSMETSTGTSSVPRETRSIAPLRPSKQILVWLSKVRLLMHLDTEGTILLEDTRDSVFSRMEALQPLLRSSQEIPPWEMSQVSVCTHSLCNGHLASSHVYSKIEYCVNFKRCSCLQGIARRWIPGFCSCLRFLDGFLSLRAKCWKHC